MARLPIDDAREAFETALAQERPVVVCAPTGSGKSTRLPAWIADDGDRVLVVEPRRVAARALAGWVARTRDSALGAEVGYQVRFDGQHGAKTRILFVTPGVALSMLADDGAARFDTVLVDEFHERAWEVDLVVALVRLARQRAARPRLVVCSATLSEEALARTLDASVVRSQGRAFPVDIAYRGEGGPSDQDLADRVAEAVRAALDQRSGDVLAFLPGKREIGRTIDALRGCEATTVAVHGGIPPSQLADVLGATDHRRVFVATNVAETSLTLPGVTSIVDSGLSRMRMHRAGHSVLALSPISQASADQRAGRAGRVAAGTCTRLWSRHFALDPDTAPELMRVELDDVLLRAAAGGLDATAVADAPWVTVPPTFAVQAAHERLRVSGALDEHGALTARGAVRARLPVSAWAGRILADPPKAIAALMCDVVAIAEQRRDLIVAGDVDDRVHEARAELFAGVRDEVETQLVALWRGDARRHGLAPAALREARASAKQLRQRLGVPARNGTPPPNWDRAALVAHLLATSPQSAFVPRRPVRGRGRSQRLSAWGNGTHEIQLRPIWIPGLDAESQPPMPPAAIVLDLEWLGVGRSAQGRGRLVLSCALSDLVAAGIGEATYGPPILERKGGKTRVVADMQLNHAGVVMESQRAPLRGPALLPAVAELLLAGRWRQLDADAIVDAHHVAEILQQIEPRDGDEDGTPLGGVVRRLEALGVASPDDIELLSVGDLIPDLDALAAQRGIDPREPLMLAKDFPRQWAFEGTRFACRVSWSQRRVELTPIGAAGRGKATNKGKVPPASALPRFRGFGVDYRKASRHIRLR